MQRRLMSFRGAFGEALLLVGLGAPLLLAGCEMRPNEYYRPELEQDPRFVRVPTDSVGHALLLQGLEPAEPLEYAVRLAQAFTIVGPDTIKLESGVREVEAIGEPCLTALDREACLAALRASFPEDGLLLEGAVLRITRGQDVVEVSDAAELAAILGVIDTPAEAVLIAAGAGYGVGGSVAVSDGFQVQVYTVYCLRSMRILLHVDPSARMVELAHESDYGKPCLSP